MLRIEGVETGSCCGCDEEAKRCIRFHENYSGNYYATLFCIKCLGKLTMKLLNEESEFSGVEAL